tara:strand:- start:463 stop:603 length:141 start_codon:yes stop_codon:yes gene_type:complete
MTLKLGKYLETIQKTPYQVKNLNWYANCTADISNIHITYHVLAVQK